VQVNNIDEVNSKSSRSHAIFSVTMSQQKLVSHNGHNGHMSPLPGSRPATPSSKLVGSRSNSRLGFDDGDWVTISSKFHFVDLAGSERVNIFNHIKRKIYIYTQYI